jgi:hypothetical protein
LPPPAKTSFYRNLLPAFETQGAAARELSGIRCEQLFRLRDIRNFAGNPEA